MAEAAPYRGSLHSLSFDTATLGIQRLGDDARLYQDPRIAIAIVGYIRPDPPAAGAGADLQGLADRLVASGEHALDGLQGEFTLLARFAINGEFLLLRSLAGKAACFALDPDHKSLTIAAEARQIHQTDSRDFPLDLQALVQQTFYQRLLDAPQRTHFVGIQRFLATYVYRFSAASPSPERRQKYWQPGYFVAPGLGDKPETAETLFERIREATRLSLASRPGYLALSGGLDSGTLWAVMRTLENEGNLLAQQVSGISQVYPGMRCDESFYLDAQDAAFGKRGLRIDMREFTAGSQREKLLQALPDHPPLSTLPHVPPLLERISQEGGKILYLGLGGDEWFSLHNHWYRHYSLPRAIAHIMRFAHSNRHRRLGLSIDTLLRRAYRQLVKQIGHRAPPPMFGPAALEWAKHAKREADELLKQMDVIDALDRLTVQRWEGQAFDIIEQMCATHGVEIRLPLMNIRLAAWCHQLAPALRHQPTLDKAMLRRAMHDTLPESIRTRIGKTRFESALINDPKLVQSLPRPEEWRTVESGYIDPGHTTRCYDEVMQGRLPPNWLLNMAWLEHYLNTYF